VERAVMRATPAVLPAGPPAWRGALGMSSSQEVEVFYST
jgi:hypothetical protein